MIGLCLQLEPVGGRRRWALRGSVNECGDGAVLMWLRRVRRGQCEWCGQYARVLLVPEDGGAELLGRCQRCVIALMVLVFQDEAMASAMASAVSTSGVTRRYEA